MKALFIACLSAHLSIAAEFLVINDIHLNVNATYNMPMPGEETSYELLKIVLQNAQDQAKAKGIIYTAIILPGDQVRHGLAAYNTSVPNPNWPLMLFTMTEVLSLISSYFPTTPILPSVGNNDVYYHDLAPTAENATQYYGELWTRWFENIPANAAIFND
jgi:hypothetical protein